MENNITRININGKQLIIVGTAHVSQASADQVKEVIAAERPDSVCIELDQQRYKAITAGNQWKQMDIFKVIKEKKALFLLINIFVSSYQKRIAKQLGIQPGLEMKQAIESAEEVGAEIVLGDRDIQITFSRIWRGIGLRDKAKLMMQIIYSVFSDEKISNEDLEKMKQDDMLNSMLKEFAEYFPQLKVPLIDERDQYLAQKIKESPGEKVVAVVGAAHVPGIKAMIDQDHDLEAISKVPPKSKWPKMIAWMIPILIISIIAYTFINNPMAGVQQTIIWVLWNGTFSAIGAALAMGHPLTILTAFVISPISSLNPLIAAGFFAGFVQAFLRKPLVADFESLPEDMLSLKGLWQNKVTRILLIVVLTNLGSSLGAIIGGANVVKLFLQNL